MLRQYFRVSSRLSHRTSTLSCYFTCLPIYNASSSVEIATVSSSESDISWHRMTVMRHPGSNSDQCLRVACASRSLHSRILTLLDSDQCRAAAALNVSCLGFTRPHSAIMTPSGHAWGTAQGVRDLTDLLKYSIKARPGAAISCSALINY